jgi:hypothetical protein
MTRAALLPAGSDPFLLAYWLRNFATWSDQVDELHISVSGALDNEALSYINDIVAAAGGTMYHFDYRTDHGTMIGFLLDQTKADIVMLCEDDGFVRRPEVIAECFGRAEEGAIVATPRGSYADAEVTGAAGAAFGSAHSYWPCFVFVAREAMAATDRQFGGTLWRPGDEILGRRLRLQSVADTFVWASYQLRAMGLTEDLRDNHRLSGQNIPDDAPWFHVGSLSSGHGYTFMGDTPEEKYREEVRTFHRLPQGDAAQRMSWWQRVWQCADGAIPDYHRRYGEELERFRRDIEALPAQIARQQAFNDRLITWPER